MPRTMSVGSTWTPGATNPSDKTRAYQPRLYARKRCYILVHNVRACMHRTTRACNARKHCNTYCACTYGRIACMVPTAPVCTRALPNTQSFCIHIPICMHQERWLHEPRLYARSLLLQMHVRHHSLMMHVCVCASMPLCGYAANSMCMCMGKETHNKRGK
jgi:hypothetical protein